MAKKVIWSPQAQRERYKILEYWAKRNKSKTYSGKLYSLFSETVRAIKLHPESGKEIEIHGVRVKQVRDYQLVYQVSADEITILAVWDCRRDPLAFKIQ